MVEQVLAAMLGDRAASHAHERTWKHFKLYTELFCDRMTLEMTGDLAACVSMQVKMETGLRNVSADAYLKQAEEVLRGSTTTSEGITHPEMFIRAWRCNSGCLIRNRSMPRSSRSFKVR